MILGFSSENQSNIGVFQYRHMGTMRGKTIVKGDRLQMRMFRAQIGKNAVGGEAFAVVLGGAIATMNQFRCERKDFFSIRMHPRADKA